MSGKGGMFKALLAVGAIAAWQYGRRGSQPRQNASRAINRWEDEGGAPAAGQLLTERGDAPNPPSRPGGSEPGAWEFPRA